MVRALLVAVAIWVVAACSLAEPPPPPGTRLLSVEVQNGFGLPAQLSVQTGRGIIQGAAQPPTVAPRSTALVDFFVPLSPEWTISVNSQPVVMGLDLNVGVSIDAGDIVIGIDPEGGTFWRCKCF